jgi:hypothetical protein
MVSNPGEGELRTSYRVTSWTAVVIFAASVCVGVFLNRFNGSDDADRFWVPTPTTVLVARYVLFGSLIPILVMGFFNRPAPRLLAAVCLMSFARVVQFSWWEDHEFYTAVGLWAFLISVASVCVMCLHHLIQRPSAQKEIGRE